MRGVVLAVVLTLSVALPARAGDKAYKADDIVTFFAGPPVTRGLCVGTDAECGVKKKSPVAFDLQINFGKNSAELNEDAQAKLLQFSLALRDPRLKKLRFAVEGFTDASGKAEHNLVLSQRRAKSVTAFLAELGIEPSRLEARGYGASRMRQPDPYDPLNRRVETHIIQ